MPTDTPLSLPARAVRRRPGPGLAVLAALLWPAGAAALPSADAPPDWPDSPWSAPDASRAAPLTAAEIRAMVEMDGDPATLTAAEAEMLEVLRQVLTGHPVDARHAPKEP